MKKIKEIFNSEGPLVAITKLNNNYFIMIKKRNCNEYSYFPLKKEVLKLYFNGEITLRELLPSFESFVFIDDYYNDEDNRGMLADNAHDILNNI